MLPRRQTREEEIANSFSHGLGFLISLVIGPILILDAQKQSDAFYFAGCCIFVATMAFLYLTSSIYHALPFGPAKQRFLIIEHSAIFLLIAGTYTPFTLGVLKGFWGWTVLGLVWSIAAVGVGLKVFQKIPNVVVSTTLYVAMGWLILIAINPLVARISPHGLQLLLAGGIAYTVGVIFFATDSRLRFGHFIWHLFVLAGTGFHYFAVLWYGA